MNLTVEEPMRLRPVVLASISLAATLAAQCPNGPVFGPLSSFPSFTQGARAIATADIDGDGDLDVLGGGSPEGLVVLRNDGLAGFVAQPAIALPGLVNGIVAADFDRDGRIDVATCGRALPTAPSNVIQGTVDVLFNTTAAGTSAVTFAAPITLPFGPAAAAGSVGIALAATDLDGNGVLDLAVADVNSTNAWVLLGQGSGGRSDRTWAAAVPYSVARTGHFDLDVADFDADGAPDLALLNAGDGVPGGVTLLRNQTDPSGRPLGTFAFVSFVPTARVSTALCVRDLDGDGLLDFAATSRQGVSVARGTGPFTFGAPVLTALQFAEDVDAADLDGDGRLDLCVALSVSSIASPGNVAVLRDLGAGFVAQQFNFGTGYPTRIALGDLDADGIVDVAVGKMTGALTLARGTCGRSGGALALLLPNGGETWTVDTQVQVDWFATPGIGPVDVELSRNGGRSWERLATAVTARPLAFRATAPSTNRALVRVLPSATTALASRSVATFTITGPGLASAAPIGSGCGAPAPTLRCDVPFLGARVPEELRGGAANAVAVFFVGLAALAPVPIGGGCSSLLDLNATVISGIVPTDAQGAAAGTLSIPGNASLSGAAFRTQALVLGAALQATNAVDLMVGL